MKNCEGRIHKKIRAIKDVDPIEKDILFAAVRSLHIRNITINVEDIGRLVRISGDTEKDPTMDPLESLHVYWSDRNYYYVKQNNEKEKS